MKLACDASYSWLLACGGLGDLHLAPLTCSSPFPLAYRLQVPAKLVRSPALP